MKQNIKSYRQPHVREKKQQNRRVSDLTHMSIRFNYSFMNFSSNQNLKSAAPIPLSHDIKISARISEITTGKYKSREPIFRDF